MAKSNRSDRMTRRDVLKGTAAAGVASSIASIASMPSIEAARAGVIHKENAHAGSTDWQLTYTKVDPETRYRCPWIEGYCSRASVKAKPFPAPLATTPAIATSGTSPSCDEPENRAEKRTPLLSTVR